jgi:hypothetical protein
MEKNIYIKKDYIYVYLLLLLIEPLHHLKYLSRIGGPKQESVCHYQEHELKVEGGLNQRWAKLRFFLRSNSDEAFHAEKKIVAMKGLTLPKNRSD